MSGAGGLRAGISGLRALQDYLAWVGGSKAAGRAAARSGLAEEIAAASVAEVNAAEAARFSARQTASGGGWASNKTALYRDGELAKSMSSYKAMGAKLITMMAPHGRYHHPEDYWPSPCPEPVRVILATKCAQVLGVELAATLARAA
jgi:hypothetical protein